MLGVASLNDILKESYIHEITYKLVSLRRMLGNRLIIWNGRLVSCESLVALPAGPGLSQW